MVLARVRRVFVAAEDASLRSAIRALVEEDGLAVVGEGSDPGGVVANARAAAPDLVILNWPLARLAGPGVVAALRAIASHPRILALSCRPEDVSAARTAGADDCVCGGDSPDTLLVALRAATETNDSDANNSNQGGRS